MTPRLYTAHPLAHGAGVALEPEQQRYLRQVLRLAPGAAVRLFNGRDGEWRARLETSGPKAISARCEARLRPQAPTAPLTLLFAPVKRTETDWIVQKATELGATALRPVLTKRTQAETVRIDRFAAIAREAAEQCERLDVPEVAPAVPLSKALDAWPEGQLLLYADEQGDDPGAQWGGPAGRAPALSAVLAPLPGEELALLVGPEGGFDPEERRWLRALAFVRPVSLGPRILRAETAVCVGLALIQAARDAAGHGPPL